ncbi:RNA degradosome polyphosphate kinase [Ornithinimicrobium sediminis]|uniref:RNA degradosome polyphosphate kinase n=1 Tax=Ornithinimicrobium sediminis TaxID=2904603 RepID=UPI001E4DAC35|nr:RNA degradosome polyphosphate kinase [Ornithinimicrobium sediminis]MCE0487335.1 RNA degradosome polyphosphate kinase [Ornithinimicrobium sediminis]
MSSPQTSTGTADGTPLPESTVPEVVETNSVVPLPQIRAQHPRGANGRFIRLEPEGEEAPSDELPEGRFLDREVSWLQFNERVLQLAADPDLPLLERTRFLAIFAGNLDEFFMVRVAGLKRRIATGIAGRSAAGLEPREVLEEISLGAHHLMSRHAQLLADTVAPALADEGITIFSWDELGDKEREELGEMFRSTVYPVLTPLAVDPAHPFPYISGLSLNLAVILTNPRTGREHFARVKVPPLLPRFVRLSTSDGLYSDRFVLLEQIIAAHLDQLFTGMDVQETFTFRVTRNEDLEVEEDDAENLLTALERELTRRRFGPPVRLEVVEDMDDHVLDLLTRELRVSPGEVYRLPAPLDLTSLHTLADLDRTELRYPNFVPKTHPDLAPVESSQPSDVLGAMRQRDILLHHPYDSFSTSVQAFIEQAAADPHVLAIKQTLYRTSGDSPVIDALIEAAAVGKQVLAVVEIKARFDEENNITWARKLEEAGVHVVYGMVGLKTHAKLALVVREEAGGLRRYCHIGTGNYNPKTARLYEDLGLLTCDETIGEDLTRLFNQLSGMAPKAKFKRLLVAPRSVRSELIALIDAEAARGSEGVVRLKLNSIVDEQVIDALYRASRAGARVDIWVRGICALRPGVPGLSETITVRSVLGRFLEHSRIFAFGAQGESGVFIGSADMMHRNLDRRVEALASIADKDQVRHIVKLMDRGMSDDIGSWHLGSDGQWTRHHLGDDGMPLPDLQTELIERYAARRRPGRRR